MSFPGSPGADADVGSDDAAPRPAAAASLEGEEEGVARCVEEVRLGFEGFRVGRRREFGRVLFSLWLLLMMGVV